MMGDNLLLYVDSLSITSFPGSLSCSSKRIASLRHDQRLTGDSERNYPVLFPSISRSLWSAEMGEAVKLDVERSCELGLLLASAFRTFPIGLVYAARLTKDQTSITLENLGDLS